jgi:hypothetical protein
VVEIFSKSFGIRSFEKIARIKLVSDSYEIAFDLISPTSESLITSDSINILFQVG